MFVQIPQNILKARPATDAVLSHSFLQRRDKLLAADRSTFDDACYQAQIRQQSALEHARFVKNQTVEFQGARLFHVQGWSLPLRDDRRMIR